MAASDAMKDLVAATLSSSAAARPPPAPRRPRGTCACTPGRRGGCSFRAQLGDEVVGVAAKERLAVLDRASVAQKPDALDEEPRVAFLGLQELCLLLVQQQR